MGANAQTAVPVFTAGQVLTAAQQTQINTGIPVFATTVTRDAAFGSGKKTLAQGQTCYIEATSTYQTYNGSAWVSLVTAPGLTLVKSQVIGTTVASVTVSDAFSATYDAYKIIITGGVASSANGQLNLTFGSASSGYSYGYLVAAATPAGVVNASASSIPVGEFNTAIIQMNTEVFNPFLTKHTYVNGTLGFNATNGNGRAGLSAYLTDSVSYTAFTLTASTGTLTGGTIRVYGYANS